MVAFTQLSACAETLCRETNHSLALHQNLLLLAFLITSGDGQVNAGGALLLIQSTHLTADGQGVRGGVGVFAAGRIRTGTGLVNRVW